MTALPKYQKISEAAFLDYLQSIDGKAEWLDGEIYDMAGGSATHALICSNINRALGNSLKTKDCGAFSGELMYRIPTDRSLVFPDASVICGEITYEFPRKDIVLNPTLIVEVLSPETADYCRSGKFKKYASIPSLREYMLVSQSKAEVEVRFRHESGLWDIQIIEGLYDYVTLQSLEVQIPLIEIYHRVHWQIA